MNTPAIVIKEVRVVPNPGSSIQDATRAAIVLCITEGRFVRLIDGNVEYLLTPEKLAFAVMTGEACAEVIK